jgi:hypothetical protein
MQKGGIVASGLTSELSNQVIQKFLAVWAPYVKMSDRKKLLKVPRQVNRVW